MMLDRQKNDWATSSSNSRERRQVIVRSMGRSLSALATTLVVYGCASGPPIENDSLQRFREAVATLSEQSESALTTEYDWTYRNFAEALQDSESRDIGALVLEFPPPPSSAYAWSYPTASVDSDLPMPVFVYVARSRQQLGELNALLRQYVDTVVALNGAGEGQTESLNTAVEALNANSRSVAGRLGMEIDSDRGAAFSVIGVAIADAYLRNKQATSLSDLLRDAQTSIDALATAGQQAMRISAAGIQAEYQTDALNVRRRFAAAAARDRPDVLEALLNLNDRTTKQLDLLAGLDDAYGALAVAHRDLATSLSSNESNSFEAFIVELEAVQALHERLQAAAERDSSDEGGNDDE